MKCVVCQKLLPLENNSIVCSDECQKIRLRMLELGNKYFPVNGCKNCWGDLRHGCSEKCRKEFREAGKFGQELWSIIRLIYPEAAKRVGGK